MALRIAIVGKSDAELLDIKGINPLLTASSAKLLKKNTRVVRSAAVLGLENKLDMNTTKPNSAKPYNQKYKKTRNQLLFYSTFMRSILAPITLIVVETPI